MTRRGEKNGVEKCGNKRRESSVEIRLAFVNCERGVKKQAENLTKSTFWRNII